MPDLDAFEVFVTIAETGSLGNAARELGLTQQAVSRRLAAMEAKAGVSLAIRTTQGSQLTAAGVSVAQWATRLLEVAHDIDAGLGALRNEGHRPIAVAASPTVAEFLMPHWLLSLRSAPHRRAVSALRMQVTACKSVHVEASVRDGSADLGFIEMPYPPTGLGHCVIGNDDLVIVVLPDHPWASRSESVSPLELAQTPLVTREPLSGVRDSLTAALRQVLGRDMQQAPPLLELPSPGAVRAAVLAGAGPAVLSRLSVTEDLATGRLCEIAMPELDLRRDLRAIWRGGRTPPVGAVRNILNHIESCRDGLNNVKRQDALQH